MEQVTAYNPRLINGLIILAVGYIPVSTKYACHAELLCWAVLFPSSPAAT
jgi:hypothetical protein